MNAVLIILSVALLTLGIAGYAISSSMIAYRTRRARIQLLQRIVRCRYESNSDYTGDRHEFSHAIQQVPAVFGGSGPVMMAFRDYRDAEAASMANAAVQHRLTELLRAMCRDVQIDAMAVREELPIGD